MTYSKIGELLFKGYRQRVLSLLLLHPDKKYHVREIARLTGTLAGTLHRELAKLEKVRILNKEVTGNQVYYSANPDCLIFSELAGIMKKTSELGDILLEALEPYSRQIQYAFIFGSVAKNTETEESDIDLMIIGEVDFSTLAKPLYNAQKTIGREINPKFFTSVQWREILSKKTPFVQDIISNPILKIIGDPHDAGG